MMRTILPLVVVLLTAPAHAFTLELTAWNETCGNANGAVTTYVINAAQPVTYDWSTGETTDRIENLPPGWYYVIVTDGLGQVREDSAQVLAVPYLDWPVPQGLPSAGLFGCGGCNAGLHMPMNPDNLGWLNVNGIFSIDPPPLAEYAGWVLGPYCENDVPMLTITDSTGCTGTVEISPPIVSTAGPMTLVGVEPACNGANGSITVDPMGGGYIMDMFTVTVYDDTWTQLAQCSQMFCNTPTFTFTGIPAGTHAVVRLENWIDPFGMSCEPETLYVTVPSLSPACGLLSGTVYIDNDQDCVQDVAEVGVAFSVLEIQPGPEYAITNSDGHYTRALLDGSYTLAQTDPTLIPLCPLPQPVPITISGVSQVIDLADSSTMQLDLAVFGDGSAARPGFATIHSLLARNLSPQVSGPVTITYAYDPVLVYASSSLAPTAIAGNTLTWEFPEFTAYTYLPINLQFNVPVGTALGTELSSTFSIVNTMSEATLGNNTLVLAQTVTGSYDPNDKTARTSSGTSESGYMIDLDEYIEYTIRFQNTGTDTAFTVVVTDTLAAELDMATFQQGVASHPFSVAFRSGRVVEWTFTNILLPDSNTNEPASHGLVSFRIRPVEPVMLGTVISNNADIFFDFNEPVRTNDAVLTAQISTGLNVVMNTPCRATLDGDRLIVFANERSYQVKTMRILAADGRVVRSHGSARIDPGGTVLSIAGLARGGYVFAVTGADGSAWSHRFVVL